MILDIGCGFAKKTDFDSFRYEADPKGDINVDIGIPEVRVNTEIRRRENGRRRTGERVSGKISRRFKHASVS